MRTGTGILLDSQDPTPSARAYVSLLRDLGADFHVHHVIPSLTGQHDMLLDTAAAGLRVVLANEYGNINGPWVPGTNRWDIPVELLTAGTEAGVLEGILYDEPEHLQINADQYRHDTFLPHFATVDGLSAEDAAAKVADAAEEIVHSTEHLSSTQDAPVPVLAEQVFPVLFHTLARAGMTPTPKIMKESFQPLQLGTALGAALQYNRDLWICADLWGPDTGPWFTRAPGFPGHSPEEYAAALRMGYLFGPSHLFTENIDVLVEHAGEDRFQRTEFGTVWDEFVRKFVPENPLPWTFRDARADIALIHADDSNFGRGTRPFGNRQAEAPATSATIFEAWHVLSRGSIPVDGSCMHIARYEFPRHTLNAVPRSEFPLRNHLPDTTATHPLFHPATSTLVFDETVAPKDLDRTRLILVVGSRLPAATAAMLHRQAARGATVVVGGWLLPPDLRSSGKLGSGVWIVFDDLLNDAYARTAVERHLGPSDLWTQRFGDYEVRFTPADAGGTSLEFEIAGAGGSRAGGSARAVPREAVKIG